MLPLSARVGRLGRPDVTARNRIARGRQPDFDIDYKDGYQGELWVADVLDSLEDGARIEVKRDRLAVETGNVYLEYECWKSGQWVKTGFLSRTAELYSIALAPMVVVSAPTSAVRAVAAKYYADERNRRECPVGGNPTRGVIVPVRNYVLELMAMRSALP